MDDHGRRRLDRLRVARHALTKVRPGGTLLFVAGTGARRPAVGLSIIATFTATATLAKKPNRP